MTFAGSGAVARSALQVSNPPIPIKSSSAKLAGFDSPLTGISIVCSNERVDSATSATLTPRVRVV